MCLPGFLYLLTPFWTPCGRVQARDPNSTGWSPRSASFPGPSWFALRPDVLAYIDQGSRRNLRDLAFQRSSLVCQLGTSAVRCRTTGDEVQRPLDKENPAKATNIDVFYCVAQALRAATKNSLSLRAEVTQRPAQAPNEETQLDQARELHVKQHCRADGSHFSNLGDRVMSGKSEELKGRVKEAAGALTDDEKLRREGKLDQATGKVKQAVEKVVKKTKDIVKDLKK